MVGNIFRKIYEKNSFNLIGYDSSSNHGPYTKSTDSVNFLTQKYRYQKNMVEDDTTEPKFKSTWYDLPKQPLLKLNDIQDIDDFGVKLDERLYNLVHPNDES